ncbi:MAG TPA: lysylphosphatidylglycerol synthase transmembrane domain-containing protein [Chloroflexota bacterium]|nr:lysylphosphatidylglycerol synthase transmembrane domain-containing protein [Chloroflexota bacterium]
MTKTEQQLADSLEAGPEDGLEFSDGEIAQKVDLGRRFANWRTVASFSFALIILVVALSKSGVSVTDLKAALRQVNPAFYVAAFLLYYVSFPLRTIRWRILMRNANTGADAERLRKASFLDLLEILYLSWFANCVIPAKLGDVYRAYLTRGWVGISASRTVGTILAERVLDLLVLFPLLLAAALLTFRDRLLADSALRYVLFGALGLGLFALVVVFVLWKLGDHLHNLLPGRVRRMYHAFREGALHSVRSDLLSLFGLTILVWSCEGGRLYLVLASLGLTEPGKLGPSAALFLALGSSVITTLPLAPGGLGFVETFLIASIKTLKAGATGGQAAAVALLDRIISYLSIVIIGFILYIISKKTRQAVAVPRNGAGTGGGDAPLGARQASSVG